VKIRFLTTIPTEYSAFHRGQVIDVEHPTAEMLAWIQPLADGSRRAEVVRDEDDLDVATAVPVFEHAVKRTAGRAKR
jgi:hypothetical protein